MTNATRVRFRVVACVLALAMVQLATIGEGLRYALAGLADFRALYGAGTVVRSGERARLYDYEVQHAAQNRAVGARTASLPFVYPAYASLPFVPLSALRYRTAYAVFCGLNMVLLGAAVGMLLPWLKGLRGIWEPLPWLLFACFYPVGVALLQGQVSIALLVVFCGCFWALERGRDVLAGALLALGLVKFNLVLPVVLLYLLWRRWRFVAGFAAGGVGVAAISLAVCGWAGMKSYVAAMGLAAGTGSVGAIRDDSMVVSGKMPDLHGLVFALAGGARWGTALTVALSIAVLAWTAWAGYSFPRAVVAALLVSYHLHLHDLSLLLLPLALILSAGVERKIRWVVLGAALLWMLSPLLIWMSGLGLNWAMTLLMLPQLLPWEALAASPMEQDATLRRS